MLILRQLLFTMGLFSFLFGGCSKKPVSQEPTSHPATQSPFTGKIMYSQVDITERFGDNERLKPDDWIETVALNKRTPNPTETGLPAVNATDEEVYEIASKMSRLRESISIPNDGVYCPICHIANIQLVRLRTPCPKCGRALLKFGWD